MKDFETLTAFLYRHRVDAATNPEKVLSLKKAYKKLYLAEYRKRNGTCRVNLTLTRNERSILEKAAEKQEQRLTTYTKNAALAHAKKQPLQRSDEQYHTLIRELNAIGNNINQVVRHIRTTRRPDHFYEDMKREFDALKNRINRFVQTPPSLLEAVTEQAKNDPQLRAKLIQTLQTMPYDNQE